MVSFRAIIASIAIAACHAPACGQTYPDKPIRVIVPVPAGGSPDVAARLLTPGLSRLLGQQLIVDNRGGAGGIIGTELAARAAPDGYTLMVSSGGPITILPHLQRKIPYDPLRDFAPVGLISAGPFVLITHPSSAFHTIEELLAAAKTRGSQINYASAGNGSPNHLATEMFKHMAKIDLVHVPYKGAPQGVTDVLGGQIDLNFSSIPPVLQHIRAGRLRALATTGVRRSLQLPEVPTLGEAAVKGYEFSSWFGLFAPAGTPSPIVARLDEALIKVVHAPETKSQFESQGAEPVGSTPKEFAAFIRREFARNGEVVRASGMKVD